MDGKTKPFGLAVPHYEEFGFKGPYFGDLVWKHLKAPKEGVDRSEKFEYIPVAVEAFADKAEKTVVKENVRERVVFIVHPPYLPPAQHMMVGAETADAIRRSDSKEIYIFDLYNSYFRQDSRTDREPITAAMVPQIYKMAGINGVFTVDPHSKQLPGFFDKMEPLPMSRRLAKRLREKYELGNAVVVAPDEGGYKRAETFSNNLKVPLAAIHKERRGEETVVKDILGDVDGKDCIILDDIIGTGTTLKNDAIALRKEGCRKVYGIATHLGLYKDAKNILRGNDIQVIGTNTIPHSLTDEERKFIEVVDISDIIASVIYNKSTGGSLRKYFESG